MEWPPFPVAWLLMGALAGCTSIPPAHDPLDLGPTQGTHGTTVTIRQVHFEPDILRVWVDDNVTWTNPDQVRHTVTPSDASAWESAGSGYLDQGRSWSITFEAPGTYDYYCEPHASRDAGGRWVGMTGQIVVEVRP